MKRIVAAALVIARRDYIATVFSRTFLFFLLGPVLAIGGGGLIGQMGGRDDNAVARPTVAVIGTTPQTAAYRTAYEQLVERNGDLSLPVMAFVRPASNEAAQAQRLLNDAEKPASAVLSGLPDAPHLLGAERKVAEVASGVRQILEEVAADRAFAAARMRRNAPHLTTALVKTPAPASVSDRHFVARGAQTILFMLTILLAGMLLSNMVEEKSNKVIEVLTAAVPVDAIFLGKLVAMLGVSLTGILVWGSLIGGILTLVHGPGGNIPEPAIGWAVFGLLSIVYYITNYMILGGVFLGIGAQASTVREVQTLSMPVTMAQLAVFGFASATIGNPDGPLAVTAALFPLSSPMTMVARAALEGALWPHLVILVWQLLWIAIIIRFAARRFRTGVLKSGGQDVRAGCGATLPEH